MAPVHQLGLAQSGRTETQRAAERLGGDSSALVDSPGEGRHPSPMFREQISGDVVPVLLGASGLGLMKTNSKEQLCESSPILRTPQLTGRLATSRSRSGRSSRRMIPSSDSIIYKYSWQSLDPPGVIGTCLDPNQTLSI